MKRKSINDNLAHMVFFCGATVRQFGRIFPWGGFRIIQGEDDDPADNESGLYCWCESLMQYNNKQYFAAVTTDHLVVFHRDTQEVVERIPLYGEYEEVFIPNIERYSITNGVLDSTLQQESWKEGEHYFSFEEKFNGRIILKLSFDRFGKSPEQTTMEDYVFVTEQGEIIPFSFDVNNIPFWFQEDAWGGFQETLSVVAKK